MQFHDLTDTRTQQDVELDKLFENVCVYNTRCMGPAHMDNIAELACGAALVYRGVAHICIPVDFQELEVKGKGNGRSDRTCPGTFPISPLTARACPRTKNCAKQLRSSTPENASPSSPGPVHCMLPQLEQVATR